MEKKTEQKSCKGKCPGKKLCKEKCKEKKSCKMGRMRLNQNYNSSRKVFQNAPNGIRACLYFQNFPGEGWSRAPYGNGPPVHFDTAGGYLPNAERETKSPKQAKPNRSAIQANRTVETFMTF